MSYKVIFQNKDATTENRAKGQNQKLTEEETKNGQLTHEKMFNLSHIQEIRFQNNEMSVFAHDTGEGLGD